MEVDSDPQQSPGASPCTSGYPPTSVSSGIDLVSHSHIAMNTHAPPVKTCTASWVISEPPLNSNVVYVGLTISGDLNSRLVSTTTVF